MCNAHSNEHITQSSSGDQFYQVSFMLNNLKLYCCSVEHRNLHVKLHRPLCTLYTNNNLLFKFRYKVSLYNLGSPGIHYVDPGEPRTHRDPLPLLPKCLKACITIVSFCISNLNFKFSHNSNL